MSLLTPETVRIPAGSVVLGLPDCPVNANLPWPWRSEGVTQVDAFWMGATTVTNAQYQVYLDDTGRAQREPHDDGLPVTNVSWEDASNYCQWLTAQTGRVYRLPHDHEWEYAARGGHAARRFPWGESADPARAWFGGQASPQPVGSLPPNEFGLFEMVGNVWEWCAERYEDVSGGVPAINRPTGKDPSHNRVLRGGSYLTTNILNLWLAYRHEDPPDLRDRCIGFRVAVSD